MQVRLPVDLPRLSLRGVDYEVRERVVDIPEDYLDDLLKAFPNAEPVVGNPASHSSQRLFDDGKNKV